MANKGYSAPTITVAVLLLFSFFCLHITEAERATKLGREKIKQLHFYFHDIVSGKNVTAVEVASAPTTDSYFTQFGLVRVMDDWLTEGPEATSKMVGRAQGIYVSTCQQNVHLLMASTFVFEGGAYNGSTLAMVGKNAVFDTVREMPIVGSSGLFRLARGYALARTHSIDLKTGNAVVEYNVTVLHY
uniref:Dirigent protein n=1 Tax=Picea sitchensis TaxID=3332 RepID=Q27JA1_PICSI|nr:dirigent-like protein pDIR11 [Picea sitchensis]